MTHEELFDVLWQKLGSEGRAEELFGEHCAQLSRQAFCSSATGSEMPIVYYEIPLAGTPRSDLQVCIERKSLMDEIRAPEEAPAVEKELLAWLVGPGGDDCTGVDLAFDISAGDLHSPQVIALPKGPSFADAEGFFDVANAPQAAALYRAAEGKVPDGWRSWYTGIMPGRAHSPVRLDYYIDTQLRDQYEQDVSLLARDLDQMGYVTSKRELGWCQDLLALPCTVNLQLDAFDDGTMGPVLGYNLCSFTKGPQHAKSLLEDGWMAQSLEMAQAWGLADDRWRRLGELCLGKMLAVNDNAGDRFVFVLSAKPTFIKIRMTPEELIDAKVYLMCTMNRIS